MAYDPNSPAATHNALTDLDQIRANFTALRNFEAGASEPSNLVAGMIWLDTSGTPYVMKQRNAANSAWLTLWNFTYLPIFITGSAEKGDLAYYDGSNWVRLPHGTAGQMLVTGGHGANPSWGSLGAATIKQSHLSTTYGEVGGHVATGISANYTLPGGTYGFYPQLKLYGTVSSSRANLLTTANWFSYVTNIYLEALHASEDCGMYALQRYVTASGKEHWLFAVVHKETGKIIHSYSAPDHPSYGNGGNEVVIPHPFPDFIKAIPEGLEIVLLDLEDTMKLKGKFLSDITDEIRIDLSKEVKFSKPRDMDGKRFLAEKPPFYSVRKIKV